MHFNFFLSSPFMLSLDLAGSEAKLAEVTGLLEDLPSELDLLVFLWQCVAVEGRGGDL